MAVLATGLALLAAPPGASGHAVPLAISPEPYAIAREPPTEVTIRYSERVEPRASSVEVVNARGVPVATASTVEPGDAWLLRVALPSLASGIYTVSWRVMSADDGHITEGAHVFGVGDAGGAVLPRPVPLATRRSWIEVAGRWMNTLGEVAVLGLLTAPLVLRGRPQMPHRRLVLGWAGVAVLGALTAALAKSAQAGGGSPWADLGMLMSTAPGRVWAAKIGLILALAVTAAAYPHAPRWRRGVWALAILLAVTTLLAGSLVSHSAGAIESRSVAIAAQMAHLLAVALWIGGLGFFATAFWQAREGTLAAAAWAIPAFSIMATVAVGGLAVSGLYLARLHVASVEELVSTPYGRWLIAKLAVAAFLLGLGAYHQFVVHRRVLAARGQPQTEFTVGRRFQRTLGVEASLGVLALLLAAVLGTTSPPHVVAAGEDEMFRQDRLVDDARVITEVWPLTPGLNTVRVTVSDRAGQPLGDATAALLRLRPTDADAAQIVVTLDRESPGTFARTAPLLALPGRWAGRLVIQRHEAYDLHDRLELDVRARPEHQAHAHQTPPAPIDLPTGLTAAGIAAAAGVLALRSRRALQRARHLATARPEPHPLTGTPPEEMPRCTRS